MTPEPVKVANGVLVGSNGMTLYAFDQDRAGAGKGACSARCAVSWPRRQAATHAGPMGPYGVITRGDSSRQWSYKGKPLYFRVKNRQPGDETGDGVNSARRTARQ